MNLYQQAQTLYINTLKTHIRLLSLDFIAHSATEGFYEELFNDFHTIWEQMEAIGQKTLPTDDLNKLIWDLYKSYEEYKVNLAEAVKTEKDEWMKNLLLWLLEKAQIRCAKMKGLYTEEVEEDEREEANDKD